MGSDGAWRGALGPVCVAFLLFNVATLQVSATTFSVQNLAPNTPSEQRYTMALGDAWTIQMPQEVRTFIVNYLAPSYKNVDHITFVVKDDPNITSQNGNNEIEVGAQLLTGVPAKDKNDLRFQ